MKHTSLFMPLLGILLLVPSCQRPVMRELDSIESCLDSSPDSALTLLQAVSYHALKTRDERARYCLLKSIIYDKNYIDLQSDSIIINAVDFYSGRRLSKNRMMALYYEGVVKYNAGDYSEAIVFLERAERDAIALENDYYTGLINRKKASIYNSWANLDSAIECQKKAIGAFRRAGKTEHADYSVLALGIELFNQKQYDKARNVLTDLRQKTENRTLIKRCDLRLAAISIEMNEDPEYALSVFQQTPERLLDLYDYGLYAIAWENYGKPDSAAVWIERGYRIAKNEADSSALDYMLSGIVYKRGDYRNAYSLVKHASDVQERHTQTVLQESLNTALKEYYQGELDLEEEKADKERVNIIWLCVFGTMLLIFIITFFIFQLKKKDRLLELQIARYAAVQKENAKLAGGLFSQRLLHIDKLSDEFFRADEKKKKELVFIAFKSYLDEFHNDEDAFKSLELSLNKSAYGIMDKLTAQVPDISGEKRRSCGHFVG